jgi:hypothetical protein
MSYEHETICAGSSGQDYSITISKRVKQYFRGSLIDVQNRFFTVQTDNGYLSIKFDVRQPICEYFVKSIDN